MKKIINGKLYNTETATELGSYQAPFTYSDFNWWQETLFIKRTKEYFLFGESHASSKYNQRYADGWGPAEKIIPLTEDEARDWAEEFLEADDYMDIFGEVEE